MLPVKWGKCSFLCATEIIASVLCDQKNVEPISEKQDFHTIWNSSQNQILIRQPLISWNKHIYNICLIDNIDRNGEQTSDKSGVLHEIYHNYCQVWEACTFPIMITMHLHWLQTLMTKVAIVSTRYHSTHRYTCKITVANFYLKIDMLVVEDVCLYTITNIFI